MKRSAILMALVASACTQSSSSVTASLAGLRGFVLFDDRMDSGVVADPGWDAGINKRYLLLTSTDTNELRVLDLWRPGLLGRGFAQAPNPLEALSIPVIARPQILAIDQGISDGGSLVTGAYAYAAAQGGQELSVVDIDSEAFFQVTTSPLALAAPVTAMVAWIGEGLVALPDQTTLYIATFDGATGGLWKLVLPVRGSDRYEKIGTAKPEPILQLDGETVASMVLIPPFAQRTLDGAPFCSTSACLAIATRSLKGSAYSRTVLVDPKTLALGTLQFPGPISVLAPTSDGVRLFGILDPEKCDLNSCGGVIGVNTATGAADGGFPVLARFTGDPMTPLGASLNPLDLSIGSGAAILQTTLLVDGGISLALQTYEALGAFTTGAGYIVPFDGALGTRIDFDGRRPSLASAILATPSGDEDSGSYTFATGTIASANIGADASTYTSTRVQFTVTPDSGFLLDGGTGTPAVPNAPFVLTVADGYLQGQTFTASWEGLISPYISLAIPADAGRVLPALSGYEGRIAVGDTIILGYSLDDGGTSECGRSSVLRFDAGWVEAEAIPPDCSAPSLYSIRAGASAPVVVEASIDGFLGRSNTGKTLTYQKNFLTYPLNYDGPRNALEVQIGDLPQKWGAYWQFTLNGNLIPYQLQIASSTCGTSTFAVVPAGIILASLPTYISAISTVYTWEALVGFPGPSALVEVPLLTAYDYTSQVLSTTGNGLVCYR